MSRSVLTDLAAFVLGMKVLGKKTATKWLAPNLRARLTIVGKGRRERKGCVDVRVQVGRPNYAEQQMLRKRSGVAPRKTIWRNQPRKVKA